MARRRCAIAAVATALVLALTACRFDGATNELAPTSTTASTIDVLAEETTTSVEDTTTTTSVGGSTTTRRVTTTLRAPATTRRPTPATTRVASGPRCAAAASDTVDAPGSRWSVSVTSTFPSTTVVINLSWPGSSGNYSGTTDANGSFTKTQAVQPSMRGQTVKVDVTVGSARCSTSFRVS